MEGNHSSENIRLNALMLPCSNAIGRRGWKIVGERQTMPIYWTLMITIA